MSVPASPLAFTPGLVAHWPLDEPAGQPRLSHVGGRVYALTERAGPVERIDHGPPHGPAARFNGRNYLALARDAFWDQPLNIAGPRARVTVCARVRRARKTKESEGDNWWQMEFIGGLWDEDARRQYGLFLNEAGKQRATAHISEVGRGTGDGPFNTTFAHGLTPVPFDQWVHLALTYDGAHIRVWLDGRLDGELPFPHGIYDPAGAPPNSYPYSGDKPGADFTVGAVWAKGGLPAFTMRNFFKGDLADLAVFDRALDASEIAALQRPLAPSST
jgi:hypothetical protein